MRTRSVLFRLSAALAIAGTSAAALAPTTAQAQSAASGDPPARVGRLARLSGTVSFHTADQQQWTPATLNYPVTSGNSFWTEPGASAEIEIGAGRLAMDQQTELDIDTLDNTQLVATQPQGGVYLNLRSVGPGETTTIRTPRGTVQIAAAGRYEVVAGDTEQPTRVTVVEGTAQMTGADGLSLSVGAHQTATVTGSDQVAGSVGPEVDDPFLTARLQAEQPPPPQAAAYQPPAVVQQMTGAADLDAVGSWTEAPQYGRVWYPPVDPGWVPYRHGHWAYVAPWGWTWVDDASWGFAPYHYGRWVDVDDRWGWVPVAPEAPYDEAPVYSPALVAFVGIAAGVAIGVGVGLALGGGRGDVGWVPLGFREPYIPPYGGSAGYIDRINGPNFSRNQNIGAIINQRRNFVNNGTVNRNSTTINNYYVNANGATLASQQVMQRGQPVAGASRPLTRQQFAQVAQPRLQPPVAPTALTPGITPAVARQHNIPAGQLTRAPPAPGPALAPRGGPGGGGPGGGGPGGIGLRPPGAGSIPAPGGAPVRPPISGPGAVPAGTAAPRPGLPALAPHGQPPVSHAPGAPVIRQPGLQPGAAPAGNLPGRSGAPGPAVGVPGRAGPPPLAPHPANPPQGAIQGPTRPIPTGAPGAPAPAHPMARAPGYPAQQPTRPTAPAAAPAIRPAPAPPARPMPAPVARPMPAPMPMPMARPAPVQVPRPAPVQVPRPAPVQVPRPAPVQVPRPAPVQVPRPAPVQVPRPAPVQVPRPVPQPMMARPAPPPMMARPAPPPMMARPAPPAPRVCPPGHAC